MSHDWHWGGADAFYTSGAERNYFGWQDARDDTPAELASKFVERFPEVAEAGRGSDWKYAGWYLEMLAKASVGEFPVAYADWDEEPDPRWLPTTAGIDSGLPMPPPGESDAGTVQADD